MKNNLFKQLSSKKNALLYKIFCASILGSSMLLVQDQLATAGPKPNKQEKYYEIEVENNLSILNHTIHKQSSTSSLLSSKDFVDVEFDGKGYGGGGPGDQGPGTSGPGNGGPRSKDYGSATKRSKGPDNTNIAQENLISKIISLDLDNNLGIKKTPQLIIDKEEISIKPQIKKPAKPKLTPIDKDMESPDEGNSLFPDIVSYAVREDRTARKVSTKLHAVAKEAKSIPSELHNTPPKGAPHVTKHNQSHSELLNIASDDSNHPKHQEPLAQNESTECTVQDDKMHTANGSRTKNASSGYVTPPIKLTQDDLGSPNQLTRGSTQQGVSVGYGSPTRKEIEDEVCNSPKLRVMDNNEKVIEINLENSETKKESKNTETSERFSKEEADKYKYKEIKIQTLDPFLAKFQRNKQSGPNQNDVDEVVRENTPNEKPEAKKLAQDGQMSLEISKPVSNKISNQTKVQNYADRITLFSFQLQALQAIEHHIDTWSSTTLTSATPSAALPAAGDHEEEESFSPLTQIMRKGTLVPWISGHYGKSIQGKIKDRAAYRADLGGFSIGSDFVLNECTVLGVSYTKITSKVKYRQDRLGDKATTDSQTFALYGQYNISDTLFAQSAISYTKGLTKHNYINQESYISSSRGFAGFVTLNNVFALSKNTFIVPRVGLRYIENKEKDAQVGNAKITGARNHYLTAILGSKILFRKDLGDVSITPGLYAGLEQPIVTKNKGSKASIIEAGQTFEYQAPASKNKNMTYNLGAEISAKRKNLVLSVSYQCSLAKKYTNHQGTLKIGLAF